MCYHDEYRDDQCSWRDIIKAFIKLIWRKG